VGGTRSGSSLTGSSAQLLDDLLDDARLAPAARRVSELGLKLTVDARYTLLSLPLAHTAVSSAEQLSTSRSSSSSGSSLAGFHFLTSTYCHYARTFCRRDATKKLYAHAPGRFGCCRVPIWSSSLATTASAYEWFAKFESPIGAEIRTITARTTGHQRPSFCSVHERWRRAPVVDQQGLMQC